MNEVWTCVDRLSIHHDINPLQPTAFSQFGTGGGSDELRCEGDENRANAGLPDRGRRPAHRGITDRKNRAIQAGVSGARRGLSGIRWQSRNRTSYRRRTEFAVRRRHALNRRKRLSDSLPGIYRLIDVDIVAVARQASTHGVAHGTRLGNDRPAPHRELRARN